MNGSDDNHKNLHGISVPVKVQGAYGRDSKASLPSTARARGLAREEGGKGAKAWSTRMGQILSASMSKGFGRDASQIPSNVEKICADLSYHLIRFREFSYI